MERIYVELNLLVEDSVLLIDYNDYEIVLWEVL